MDKDDEFLHGVFTCSSQVCFEKAKEHIEKERDLYRQIPGTPWASFLAHLLHLLLAEKSYIDIGFLQNKNKGFLRKDNSLKSVYEQLKRDIKNVQDQCRPTQNDKRIANYCKNVIEYIAARIALIEFYEKLYLTGSTKHIRYLELQNIIQGLIAKQMLCFTDITLTPLKAIFSLECEILEQLVSALVELQKLQFLPSLSLIYGAHTRLSAWETKMQNRESWKLGFLKNAPLPLLFQWLTKFKSNVMSKYSLYFHDTLSKQTSASDLRQQCSKLSYDHYQKMSSFQRKYDASSVFLLGDPTLSCDKSEFENFPVIVSYPNKCPSQLETVQRMIGEVQNELEDISKIIYKYSTMEQLTYVLITVEPSIYLVVIFENKKTEKDAYISNFLLDLCVNLRCSKVFLSLKPSK